VTDLNVMKESYSLTRQIVKQLVLKLVLNLISTAQFYW